MNKSTLLNMKASNDQWEILEPEGAGHDLLCEWGAWNKDETEGRASWSVKPRIDPCTNGVPPNKVNIVDKILAPIKRDHRLTYAMVDHYYRRDKSIWQVGLEVDRTSSEVIATLQRVCGLVEREFGDY